MSGSFSENGTCVASLGVSFEVSGLRMGASIWLIDESLARGGAKCALLMRDGVAGVLLSCRLSLQAVARCRLSGGKRAEGSATTRARAGYLVSALCH